MRTPQQHKDTKSTAIVQLQNTLKLLNNGKNWIQHRMQVDNNFCLYGALLESSQEHDYTDAYNALKNQVFGTLTRFNDTRGRTFSEIEDVIKSAIESLQ